MENWTDSGAHTRSATELNRRSIGVVPDASIKYKSDFRNDQTNIQNT